MREFTINQDNNLKDIFGSNEHTEQALIFVFRNKMSFSCNKIGYSTVNSLRQWRRDGGGLVVVSSVVGVVESAYLALVSAFLGHWHRKRPLRFEYCFMVAVDRLQGARSQPQIIIAQTCTVFRNAEREQTETAHKIRHTHDFYIKMKENIE